MIEPSSHSNTLSLAQSNLAKAREVWKLDICNKTKRQTYLDYKQDLLTAERLAASHKKRPHALPYDPSATWVNKVNHASIIADTRIFIIVIGSAEEGTQIIFDRPQAFRSSNINDEIITGHPLYGNGLAKRGAFIIVHSPWLKEVLDVFSVHPQYDPTYWLKVKHFMICCSSEIFEVLTIHNPSQKLFSSRMAAIDDASKYL